MRPPRVLVVQHQETCPPARLGRWLEQAGCALDVRRADLGDPLPDDLDGPDGHDGLVVLGGTMGAGDTAEHPWLTTTQQLVRGAARAGRPVLGVCLGHQLCAVALGGAVERNPAGQQVGLLPLGWTAEAAGDPLVARLVDGLADGPVGTAQRGVHWNDDVVTRLPPGAVRLASAPGGEVQVARLAETVWGVQLHPEANAGVVSPWSASDAARHRAAGLDPDALVASIAAAEPELEATWQPLAGAFAALLRPRAGAPR